MILWTTKHISFSVGKARNALHEKHVLCLTVICLLNGLPFSLVIPTGKLIRRDGRKTNCCRLQWHESCKNQLILKSESREKCFNINDQDRTQPESGSWVFWQGQKFYNYMSLVRLESFVCWNFKAERCWNTFSLLHQL